jgi:hypothetical protein
MTKRFMFNTGIDTSSRSQTTAILVPDWIENFQNPNVPELFSNYARGFPAAFFGPALHADQ